MALPNIAEIKDKVRSNAKQPDNLIVALDIGTEYAKALIARVDGDDIAIIGVGRQKQSLSDMHSGAVSDISGVVSNCEKALTQAEQQCGHSARRAVLGIAGELVKGSTIKVKYKRADPTSEITVEEMQRIILKAQQSAKAQAKKELSWELGGGDVDITLVNSALVNIYIDSYKVSNPIGFSGKEVVVQLFTAFAPMIHISALERVATELDLDIIAVAAEPFAVARSVIGNDASSNFTSILIDIGGGTTDIAVVNDGGVEGTKMFGIGGRSFTRTVATELQVDYEKAESLKCNLEDTDEYADVVTAIGKTLDVWLKGVELALGEFTKVDHLPDRILLCGGGASLQMLFEALQEKGWYHDLPFAKSPTIQRIKPSQILGIEDETGNISDHTYVTAMGLLRVGHDTLDGDVSQQQTIKDKFNRILKI